MSVEKGDRRPELTEVMSGAVITVSEQSSELMQKVVQALQNSGQPDIASLTAAFDLNASLSQTLKEFLENQGQVVFPEKQSIQPTAINNDVDEGNRDEPSAAEDPKTFGELLRAKIDNDLLPEDRDSFAKSEIFEVAKNKGAVRKAAIVEGFKAQKTKFTKEETIQILYRAFTTPPGQLKKRREFYNLKEIKNSFERTGNMINRFSGEINYDWTQNPTINYQTAMELRGLVRLEQVITGEKVARKGRPGAQFGRRPVFPRIPLTDSPLALSDQP